MHSDYIKESYCFEVCHEKDKSEYKMQYLYVKVKEIVTTKKQYGHFYLWKVIFMFSEYSPSLDLPLLNHLIVNSK